MVAIGKPDSEPASCPSFDRMAAPLHIRPGQVWRNRRQLKDGHDPQREIVSITDGVALTRPVGHSKNSYLATSSIRVDRILPSLGFELLFDPGPAELPCPAELAERYQETVQLLDASATHSQAERAALLAVRLGPLAPLASFVSGSLLDSGQVWRAGHWVEAAGFVFDGKSGTPLPGELARASCRRTVRSPWDGDDPLMRRALADWRQRHLLLAAQLDLAS